MTNRKQNVLDAVSRFFESKQKHKKRKKYHKYSAKAQARFKALDAQAVAARQMDKEFQAIVGGRDPTLFD